VRFQVLTVETVKMLSSRK